MYPKPALAHLPWLQSQGKRGPSKPRTYPCLLENFAGKSWPRGRGQLSPQSPFIRQLMWRTRRAATRRRRYQLQWSTRSWLNVWAVRKMGLSVWSTPAWSASHHQPAMSALWPRKSVASTGNQGERAKRGSQPLCLQAEPGSWQVSGSVATWPQSNTILLATWGVPKDLAKCFDLYETQANSNQEQLKEMSQQIDVLHSESNTIHQFCMDWLLTIYKTLMARDVKTATAFWSILTMHHGKQTLNCHVCDTVAQLETTVGQPAFTDTLPPPFSGWTAKHCCWVSSNCCQPVWGPKEKGPIHWLRHWQHFEASESVGGGFSSASAKGCFFCCYITSGHRLDVAHYYISSIFWTGVAPKSNPKINFIVTLNSQC